MKLNRKPREKLDLDTPQKIFIRQFGIRCGRESSLAFGLGGYLDYVADGKIEDDATITRFVRMEGNNP